MIRYQLICALDHEFEGWFSNSADYDTQKADGLLSCPICGHAEVDKAIMAPAVSTARKKAAIEANRSAFLNAAAAQIRDKIASDCEDVGDNFAREARAIHEGERPERGIYGRATPDEADALIEDGITAMPLPDILTPVKKDKLN